ncbi:MAG TPA: nitrogenase component 1, partial [Polyangiaceae bacterium]|nr:nitrogenase component 1 [Polyangiaceae bacterium]
FGTTYAGGSNAGGALGGTGTPCSCLVEEHVVFGGETKLRNLIKSTSQLVKGDLFAVISGCVPSLIGDDTDAVVREFKDKAAVVHVKAPGFGGNSYQGYELFFEAVADQLLEPRPVKKGSINLLGVVPFQHLFWKGALATLKATFAKIGVDANIIFTEFDGIANLRRLPSAELNVVLSPWNGHRVAAKLKHHFATPWLSHPRLPVGPKQTTLLIRDVAAALSLDRALVERVIAEEERHAYRFAEYFGDGLVLALPHAYFAVVADAPTAIGVTQYLANEIAYIPDIVIISDNPPEAARKSIVHELTEGLEVVNKPEVLFEADAHRIRQKLKNRNFLFLLASSLEKIIAGEEYGAMHHTIAFPSYDRLILDRSYAGYRGGLALVEELTSKWVGPL